MENQQIYEKLSKMEKSIQQLKLMLAAAFIHKNKDKLASLDGILDGMSFTDEEIKEAKKSISKIEE